MKNVMIILDEEVARWIRKRADERDTSVSRLVGSVLRHWMENEERYESAREQDLSATAQLLSRTGSYPDRNVIHDRAGLR